LRWRLFLPPCCRRRVLPVFAARALTALPWTVLVVLCVTVGLAPFRPPHVVTKLRMLVEGRLVRPIDWVDLFLHMSPWLLLIAKAALVGGRAILRA
jgi:hypothetical protein